MHKIIDLAGRILLAQLFLKNFAIAGGLLVLAAQATAPGLSLDARRAAASSN
jgi:hypothetical protein